MENKALVYRNGKSTEVKNLGWLLRHSKDVLCFHVGVVLVDGRSIPALRAILNNGHCVYETPFADISVLHEWLNRSKFKGLTVDWLMTGELTAIGSTEYEKLEKYTYALTSW